ncbi:MAG: 3-deoxy-manno-octulosonate cytidylyltransferase [Candidatus Omnitrophica bacterium]|jgi:3-deoxy-manno-octulosonate cytidylyltransferase (CMP-KDO synthetase)|nr:3-deoxy-manno-octulosonate cytidylyltransferase [Candidatus Omnitrophota bacterium]
MQNNIDVIGVIPARYESSRLAHKLLREVCGKPLIQWAWENASKASLLDRLIIACDNVKIKEVAESFGAKVVMTSTKHQSGTDRIAEAVRDIDAKIVINIQADEPIMHQSTIDSLAREMINNPATLMATVRKKIEADEDTNNPNVVKLICDKNDFAIYFSRYPIPYYRDGSIEKKYYKHLGIYAYTKDFLYTFKNLPSSFLENAERLEQLRAIEAGHKIKVIETKFESIGVDTEEDLQKVETVLNERKSKNAK